MRSQMERIRKALRSAEGLSDYRITEKQTVSRETFFVKGKLETTRATDTTVYSVTVYRDAEGVRGDSTFSVSGSTSDEELKEKISRAAARAGLIRNKPYEIPGAGISLSVLPTNFNELSDAEPASKIAEAVFSAHAEPGVTINALEIFVYTDRIRVVNSRGVDREETRRRAMIEAIPTYTDEKGSVELYEAIRFNAFSPERIREEMETALRDVAARAKAEKPKEPLNARIVLRPKEIEEILDVLSYDLNYASVYSEMNVHKIGDRIQEGEDADPLTLTCKAMISGSVASASFDEDGLPLQDCMIVDHGTVKGYYGAFRFGQYLGVERPTGNLGCLSLEPGTLTEEDLLAAPYVECISMSGLQVDLYTDYIGGEIRLALYFDGKDIRPVTGISFSARLGETLSHLRLSSRTAMTDFSEVPEKLLITKAEIL